MGEKPVSLGFFLQAMTVLAISLSLRLVIDLEVP
jgi:hypothetical protein